MKKSEVEKSEAEWKRDLSQLRRAPGAPVRRRARADRSALLHQLGVDQARPEVRGLPHLWEVAPLGLRHLWGSGAARRRWGFRGYPIPAQGARVAALPLRRLRRHHPMNGEEPPRRRWGFRGYPIPAARPLRRLRWHLPMNGEDCCGPAPPPASPAPPHEWGAAS